MIGDQTSDVEAGHAAGCATIFIDFGYVDEHPERPDFTVASLGEAAKNRVADHLRPAAPKSLPGEVGGWHIVPVAGKGIKPWIG